MAVHSYSNDSTNPPNHDLMAHYQQDQYSSVSDSCARYLGVKGIKKVDIES